MVRQQLLVANLGVPSLHTDTVFASITKCLAFGMSSFVNVYGGHALRCIDMPPTTIQCSMKRPERGSIAFIHTTT